MGTEPIKRQEQIMSNAWDTLHRRAAAVRTVIEELDETGTTDPRWTDELAEVFASPDDLLVALHDVWSRRLIARVEMALELGEDLPAESIENAWFEVAADLPGVRRVLDAHAADEALAKHEQHEHRLLAIAAGMVSPADPLAYAARAGARLVGNIRAQHVEPLVPRPRLGERLVNLINWRDSAELAERAASR
jgi:hypothetical protein